MKDVNEAAAPILGRMAGGDLQQLSDAEKTAVSAWAAMFTMTYEFADRRTQATTQSEREHLMKTREPPENWKVWIAEHSGGAWASITQHKGMRIEPHPIDDINPVMNTQSTTFTFGKLLLNTFSTRTDFNFKAAEYGFRLGLQTVWPLNGYVIRKPVRPHNDKEVEFIANALEWAFDDFIG